MTKTYLTFKNNALVNCVLAITLLSNSSTVFSMDISDKLTLNAFINQGYVNSPDNPYYGEKDGSFEFRDLVLNANWHVNENIRFSGQVLNRTVGKIEKSENSVDYLLVDFTLAAESNYTTGFRLGRNKIPFGLYNSARDISMTRPGVVVPESTYFEEYRDLLLSTNGINLYYDSFNEFGIFQFEAYAGSRDVSDRTLERYSSDFSGSGTYESKGFSVNFVPNIEHDITLNFSLLDSTSKVTGEAAYGFVTLPVQFDFEGQFKIASIQYNLQDWIFTTEYVLADTISTIETPFGEISNKNIQSEGYYFQAEWLINQSFTALARYDEYFINNQDRDGSASATAQIPANNFFAKGLTVGGRWLINSNLSLTAEYSKKTGTAGIETTKNYDLNNLKKDWNLFRAELTYQF